jgi:hypothetical protein
MSFILMSPRSCILHGTLQLSTIPWGSPRESQSRSNQVLVANAQQREPRVLPTCAGMLDRCKEKSMTLRLFSPCPWALPRVALPRGDQILVAYAEPSALALAV